MSEKEMLELEERIPAKADKAFKAARDRALAAGRSVVFAENGMIFRLFPDGTRKELKRIAPPVRLKRAAKFLIK